MCIRDRHNVRVKVGLTPFILNGKKYDYGTYMIPVKNQNMSEEDLYNILKDGADFSHITIYGTETGYTRGIDLGSRDFSTVKKPEIAILVGEGIRSYDAGEIWHLLDTRHKISISKIDIRELNKVDLSRYTHFIIPSFEGSGLDSQVEKLKEFDAVIFLNTTGEVFKSKEAGREDKLKKSLVDFVKSGKGLIGMHSATDTYKNWKDFNDMMGGAFAGHPWHTKIRVKK